MIRQGEAAFVDNGAWTALALSRNPPHEAAREQWELLAAPPRARSSPKAMAPPAAGPTTRRKSILRSITFQGRPPLPKTSMLQRRVLFQALQDMLDQFEHLQEMISADGNEITLRAGVASIVLKKDGTITITGKDITIRGSGKVSVRADGDLALKGSRILDN